MTNFIQTDQEQKRCPSMFGLNIKLILSDIDCLSFNPLGRCIKTNSSSRCEFKSWCPVVDGYVIPEPSLETSNLTLLIRNFIEFPRFKIIRTNMALNPSYVKQCNYDPVIHRTCPVFRIGTLLNIVEPDTFEQMNMLKYGAVIRIAIDWQCDLDKSLGRCFPTYSFRRLDTINRATVLGQGFSFR
jgi:hypothetical protein